MSEALLSTRRTVCEWQSEKLALLLFLLFATRITAIEPDLRLITAAQEQNTAAVKALIEENVDVNAARADGVTALHWGAHWNNGNVVRLLLEAGAKPNARNSHGVTPLLLASENGHFSVITQLLSAGATASAAQNNGVTPLMMGARAGASEVVQALLTHGAAVRATIPSTGQTALMWATAEGHIDVMQLLINAGAEFRIPSTIGFTPLLFATRNGDIGAVETLIVAGADVNQAGDDGTHALPLAIISGHAELAEFLLAQGANPNGTMHGITALHAAVGNVDIWLRDWLRARLVSVFSQTTAGLSPMQRVAIVRTLLAYGAETNARISASTTVAPYVSGKYGAFGDFSVGTGDLRDATPLWVAAYGAAASGPEAVELIRILLATGADLNLSTHDGTTPLMAAAGLGGPLRGPSQTATNAVRILVEAGANVADVNEANFTALHGAAFRGSNDVAQYLVEQGANINAIDFRGRTPYRIAEGAQHTLQFHEWPETAALLASLGADTTLGAPENIGRQEPAIGSTSNDESRSR